MTIYSEDDIAFFRSKAENSTTPGKEQALDRCAQGWHDVEIAMLQTGQYVQFCIQCGVRLAFFKELPA
jgi:hypothetical protein